MIGVAPVALERRMYMCGFPNRVVSSVVLATCFCVPAANADRTIRARGRFVYERADHTTMDADRAYFEVRDVQPIVGDETLYAGYTQPDGSFDVTFHWEYDDNPDLYVNAEYINDWVLSQVFTLTGFNSRSTQSRTLENFPGTDVDFGNIFPPNSESTAGAHILSTITRARRYIEEVAPFIEIPDVTFDHPSPFTLYPDPVPFSAVTHPCGFTALPDGYAWQTATLIHEYGHHLMYWNSSYFPLPLAPPYCNPGGYGDPVDFSIPLCELIAPFVPPWVSAFCWSCGEIQVGCGHTGWCPENAIVAWQEGVPNFLADVTIRRLIDRYPHQYVPTANSPDRGTDFNFMANCGDAPADNPVIVEGFIAKLLVDMEDPADPPNPNSPCSGDVMAMGDRGVTNILTVIALDRPTDVLEFLAAYRARYAGEVDTYRLWRTARSVLGPANVDPPDDTQPPGPVAVLRSPSHPFLFGGSWPIIDFDWDPPSDDASGAVRYAITLTPQAGGAPIAAQVDEEPRWSTPPLPIGFYMIEIVGIDCAGHVGAPATFGPFVVLDCNHNGVVDVCDTDCNYSDARIPAGFCATQVGCGTATDCNGNRRPDDCDIASGGSADCNLNGVPDECESTNFVTWNGCIDCGCPPNQPNCVHPLDCSWDGVNCWDGLRYTPWSVPGLPGPADHVCIGDASSGRELKLESFTDADIASLVCYAPFRIEGGTLRPHERSAFFGPFHLYHGWVSSAGDIELFGNAQWSHGEMSGPPGGNAATIAHDGFTIQGDLGWINKTLVNRTLRLEGNSVSNGTAGVHLLGSARIENHGTFTFNQGALYFGEDTTLFENRRSIVKLGGGTVETRMPFENHGLLDVREGVWHLGGGTQAQVANHTGTFAIAESATLAIAHNHNFGEDSTVRGERVVFDGGIVNIEGTYDVCGQTLLDSHPSTPATFLPGARIVELGQRLIANYGILDFRHGLPINVPNLELRGGQVNSTTEMLVSESMRWTSGTIGVPPNTPPAPAPILRSRGTLTVEPAGLCLLADRRLVIEGSAEWRASGSGQFQVRGTGVIENRGRLVFRDDTATYWGGGSPRFENFGALVRDGNGFSLFAIDFLNAGRININRGTIRVANHPWAQTSGSTTLFFGTIDVINAPITIDGGTLNGIGEIRGAVTNRGGTVSPGLIVAQPLRITGSYFQEAGGTLETHQDSGMSGQRMSRLEVRGPVTLGGTLRLQFPPNSPPNVGDRFLALTGTSVGGDFAELSLPEGIYGVVEYLPTQVWVRIVPFTPPCPGDLDANGHIDMQDMTILLGHYGTADGATYAEGDIDGNGTVDIQDFTLLLSRFATQCD